VGQARWEAWNTIASQLRIRIAAEMSLAQLALDSGMNNGMKVDSADMRLLARLLGVTGY
jgi:hypothetical protein